VAEIARLSKRKLRNWGLFLVLPVVLVLLLVLVLVLVLENPIYGVASIWRTGAKLGT
jgi:hypothetical protein